MGHGRLRVAPASETTGESANDDESDDEPVQFGSAIRSVLCGPGTSLTEILDRKALFFWTFARFDENHQRVKDLSQGVSADILMENLREVKLPSETPEPHELAWESGVYGLDRLIVLRPSRSPNVEAGRRSFDVLVGSSVVLGGPAVQIRGDSVWVYDGVQNRGGPPSKKDLETITPALGRPGFGGMGGGGTAEERATTITLGG